MKAPKLYLTVFLLGILLAVSAALTLASVPATATPEGSAAVGFGLHFAGHLGGPARAIAVREPYAYVAFGPELAVLDISDRDNPRRVGYTLLGSTINALVVRGSYAYVAADDGLYVVSVSTPTAPIGVAKLGGFPYIEVAVEGNYAYALQETGRFAPTDFQIIDITLPAGPRFVSSLENGGRTLAVKDGFVYLTGGGLSAVDVRDPAAPTRVGSPMNVGMDQVYDIEIQEDYLYVSGQLNGGSYPSNCLSIVRHPKPATLTEEGFVCAGAGTDYNNLAVSGQTVYLAGGGITPIDVSNPEEPTILGFSSHFGDDLEIVGDYLYTIDEGHGLTILHEESPTELTKMGSFETIGSAADVAVRDGTVYVADNGVPAFGVFARAGGLKVVAGEGAAGFRVTGSNSQMGNLGGITLEGERAYLTGGNLYSRSGSEGYGTLGVASLEEPGTPSILRQVHLFGCASDFYRIPSAVSLVGQYAYVGFCGTRVFDVSDPLSPTQATRLDFTMSDLVTRGSHAYVAVEVPPGLRVLDVSQPGQPEQVGSLEIAAKQIAISDTYAYVATGEEGLRVLDISDPEAPRPVGSFDPRGSVEDVALLGRYAFIAEEHGVRVLSLSNPTQPTSLAFYLMPHEELFRDFERIYLADGLIYVADGSGGLYRFRFGPLYSQFMPIVSWP